MNDMVHVGCEEMISADDEAQMEHERAEHERAERAERAEREETWASVVAVHGPLMSDAEWTQYLAEYSDYMDMVWKD